MRLGKERQCYRLLREECGFTHHQVRTLAYRNFPSQRWVRAIGKERTTFVESMQSEIEAIALQCVREDPRVAARAVLALVWNDRKQPPAVCWTVVSEALQRIAEVMEWDRAEIRKMWSVGRSLREWEANQGHKRWTEDHIRTYLIIKGYLPPDAL